MSGKSTGSTEPDRRIQDILDGNIEAYVRWAEMRIHGLERNREFLKKQARVAEQRCAAAERLHSMAMNSEAAQRERAQKAEKRLAQAEERLAEMATKHQKQSGTNRPLEKAIIKLARNSTIVKKLVLVVHPDKAPKEVSDSASELFRFLQSIREKTE